MEKKHGKSMKKYGNEQKNPESSFSSSSFLNSVSLIQPSLLILKYFILPGEKGRIMRVCFLFFLELPKNVLSSKLNECTDTTNTISLMYNSIKNITTNLPLIKAAF